MGLRPSILDDLGLGWRSHLLAFRFGAEIEALDGCVVVRSPGNPTYYWGNCLILPAAPRERPFRSRRANDDRRIPHTLRSPNWEPRR